MATATGSAADAALAAIKAAGFPQSEWNTALRVAAAESGLNPRAVNNKNRNGSVDYGLFQINSIHRPTAAEKTDATANAKKAYQVWKEAGNSWRPWVAFNSGAYKQDRITELIKDANPLIGAGEAISDTAGAVASADPFATVKAAVQSALDKLEEFLGLWLMVIMAMIFIGLGVAILLKDYAASGAIAVATRGLSKYVRGAGKAAKVAKAVTK